MVLLKTKRFFSMLDENFCESGLKTLSVFVQYISTPTIEVLILGCQNCVHFKMRHDEAVIALNCKIVTNYELMVG
jgi:hypothetical protein